MSGNPFRRKAEQEHLPPIRSDEAARVFDEAVQSVVAAESGRRPSSVKKTVRIKTPPPLSPDSPANTLIRRVSNEGHTGSPPPQSPVENAESQDDPFGRGYAAELLAQESKEVVDNTRRNSETATMPPPPTAAMVLNPFQKTLATLEPQRETQHREIKAKGGQASSEGESATSASSSFDVDSFTKMMATGAAPQVALSKTRDTQESQNRVHPKPVQPKDDKDSIVSSSSPRPSASDPGSGSYADLSSATSEEGSENEGDSNDFVSRSSTSTRPPPPPQHKHGKSTQRLGPQSVSFTDFGGAPSQFGDPLPATSSDKNVDFSSHSQPPRSRPNVAGSQSTASSTEEKSRRLRTPPPVPTTRRSSSLRSKSGRDAETSSISSAQPQSPTYDASSPTDAKPSKAPPPPPSRRSGTRTSLPPDQLSTSEMASLKSETTSLAEDSISTDSSMPRHPSVRASSRSRASSGSIPTTSNMPPPPPPRRRRGSSKSSMEAPVSGENRRASQESSRRVSGLGQVSEAGPETNKSSKDIMADLSAFQAEVDALRAESLRRAS